MQPRKIVYTDSFRRNLKSLARKKYPDLQDTVEKFLNSCSASGVPAAGHKIPGVGRDSVFKSRLPLKGKGKRRGARIIYFCDANCVVALFIYAKNALEDVPSTDIRKALKVAGLFDIGSDTSTPSIR